ncbi:MAG: hypothetical protein ABIP71_16055 [Verrucomicrobiota bacterium]
MSIMIPSPFPSRPVGDCFRRWKARLGTPKAITAMAHKLARIIWHIIKFQQPYDPSVWNKAEEKLKKKKLQRLEQNAARPRLQTHRHSNNLDA